MIWTECCFCIPFKHGVYIIALLNLFEMSLRLARSSFMIAENRFENVYEQDVMMMTNTNDTVIEIGIKKLLFATLFHIILDVVAIIVSMVLLYGIISSSVRCFVPFMLFNLVQILLTFITVVILIADCLEYMNKLQSVTYEASLAGLLMLGGLIEVYLLTVIHAYYKALKMYTSSASRIISRAGYYRQKNKSDSSEV